MSARQQLAVHALFDFKGCGMVPFKVKVLANCGLCSLFSLPSTGILRTHQVTGGPILESLGNSRFWGPNSHSFKTESPLTTRLKRFVLNGNSVHIKNA